jgi:tetratricopeptide (TPR) repeat protein
LTAFAVAVARPSLEPYHGPVGLFAPKPYRRRDSLTAASTAQRNGKPKKAITEYERIIENDGVDPMVLHKLATCLAMVGRTDEARSRFLAAAANYEEAGFADKALGIYTAAAQHIPGDVELWERIAQAQLRKERRAQAIKVLLEATRHFRGKKKRAERMQLLEHVQTIEPWHLESGLTLARDLARGGRRDEARELLEGLVERNEKRNLRRVRGALFRLSPTPAALWRWLRAALLGR